MRNTKFDPWQTSKELETLLKLPRPAAEDRVLTWIRAGLYLITPEQVREAVQNNVRADQVIFQHLHLMHPLVKPLAKSLFQIFWNSVSHYLTDATELYSILAANPEIKKVLDTPAGRRWMDQCCIYGYVFLYNYVWS